MKKIESLTKEQEAQVEIYREEWKKLGYSTERMDKKRAEKAIIEVYKLINLPAPEIVYCDSPYQGCLTAEAAKLEKKIEKLSKEERRSAFNNYYWLFQGSWGLYWLAFYDFPRKYIPDFEYSKEQDHQLDVWIEVAQSLGGFIPYNTHCFITDRPTHLEVDSEGRLHSENGPALLYKDGFCLYKWHNITVPQLVIEEPKKITVAMIDKEANAEVKRVMIERFGWDNYLRKTKATLVDEYKDQLGNPVKLWRKDLGREFEKPLQMVELINSTPEPGNKKKSYMFHVPEHIKTAKAAHAWHCGFEDADEIVFIEQS